MALKPGDICWTPFEPRGLVRVIGPAGLCIVSGEEVVSVEFLADHPHGYPKGDRGAYYARELTPTKERTP